MLFHHFLNQLYKIQYRKCQISDTHVHQEETKAILETTISFIFFCDEEKRLVDIIIYIIYRLAKQNLC